MLDLEVLHSRGCGEGMLPIEQGRADNFHPREYEKERGRWVLTLGKRRVVVRRQRRRRKGEVEVRRVRTGNAGRHRDAQTRSRMLEGT